MENRKNFAQQLAEKVSSLLKRLGTVAVLASAMIAGFCIGYYYETALHQVKGDAWQEAKTLKTTSIAVNEKEDLLIIDRKTGAYTIYSDSVGRIIFNLYAQRAYVKVNGQ